MDNQQGCEIELLICIDILHFSTGCRLRHLLYILHSTRYGLPKALYRGQLLAVLDVVCVQIGKLSARRHAKAKAFPSCQE